MFVKAVLYIIQIILSTDCVDILPFPLDVHTGACGEHATFADKVLGFLVNSSKLVDFTYCPVCHLSYFQSLFGLFERL